MLYEAANVILIRPVKVSLLKSWAMRLSLRAGMRKAKVALARKLRPNFGVEGLWLSLPQPRLPGAPPCVTGHMF
jgi:hypothetical protein